MALYTPKQAATRLGISGTSLRTYTDKYARHLSTEATATPRRFTADDIHALTFIVASTGQGKTHDQILAGWEIDFPNFVGASEDEEEDESAESTALVPAAQLQAARALMLDAQRREQEAHARADEQARQLREQAQLRERELQDKAELRERALQDKVEQLLRELGKTETELAVIRAQMQSNPKESRSWLARLFGGA